MPALNFAGFNPVKLLPFPLKVPLKLTPVSVLVTTSDGNCATGSVPFSCDVGSVPSRLLALLAIIA